MTLSDRIEADMRAAMKSGDAERVGVLRLVRAALVNAAIAARSDLDDAAVEGVLRREVKQRRDSIDAYTAGGRSDLVAAEVRAVAIVEAYLPELLSEAEVEALVAQVIADTGATGPQAAGKVIGPVMKLAAGRADGRLVGDVTRRLLAGD